MWNPKKAAGSCVPPVVDSSCRINPEKLTGVYREARGYDRGSGASCREVIRRSGLVAIRLQLLPEQ